MPQAKGDLQLAIGYWIVSHKPTLRKWWAISLLVFIGGSFIWTVVFFGLFFQHKASDDILVIQAAERLGRISLGVHAPEDVTTSAVTVLPRDTQHVDVAATVTNPNAMWGASKVTYHWVIGGRAIAPEDVFVNPSSKRLLVGLNQSVIGSGQTATVVIDSVDWTHVGRTTLPAALFVTDAVTISPTTITAGGQSINTVHLAATVMNRSVYNYFKVVVPVAIMAGETIVAVDVLSYSRWPTLSSRSIVSTWSYQVLGATTAEITPQVSQFDPDNIYR